MTLRCLHIICLIACLYFAACKEKAEAPDLKESYARKDTRPFGGNIAYRILEHSYQDIDIEDSKKPFASAYRSKLKDSSSLFVCISRQFLVEEEDAEAALDYVYAGNTFFLSSSNIDSVFLNKLFCTVERKPFASYPSPVNYQQTSISLITEAMPREKAYSYYYAPFASYFSEINDIYCRILGYNASDRPNCIVFFWGKGKFILHTDPRAFSNYFLLKANNDSYFIGLLQLLDRDPDQVVWDSYYQNRRSKRTGSGFSSFSEIFKHPPLKAAFWLALVSLAVYVLFGGKRRQRVIRETDPNVNSSVAFTETIARLYLQKKDNKNMADKMVTYFNEFIRTHYFLPVNPRSDEFVKTLSRKSGVPLQQTDSLFRAIHQVSEQTEVSDFELLSLNEQIQQFYKNRI